MHTLFDGVVALQQAAEILDAEPAPRALSPIAYDAKSRLFVLFGGDHLDYMTNDTWVFDPAQSGGSSGTRSPLRRRGRITP